jgi:hypothetical protein
MWPVYAHIAVSVVYIAGSMLAMIGRHAEPWLPGEDVRLRYDIMFGGILPVFCLVVNVGLLMKREWGRALAVSFDIVAIAQLLLVPVGLSAWVRLSMGGHAEAFRPELIALGAAYVALVALLNTKGVRAHFGREKEGLGAQ